ncbi:MAG: AAA family ATPase [Bacillota bacterium]|nr:AAA family ATPase [Bacillota bacterium]
MIIRKLNIKSFGKLKDIEIEFNSGLNIIYGPNEAGKSTMQQFIKAMFYGMNSQRKDIRENERKRFLPWYGGQAEGRLVFEDDNGREYAVERSFGDTKKEDQAAVFNWITGEKAVHIDSSWPGRDIFGLGEEAFDKTLFIKQLGAQVARDKEDEIMKKLINLHQSGEEDTSYHNAQSTLEDVKKTIRGIRKKGQLDELHDKIHLLNMEKSELQKLYEENIEDSLQLRNINRKISNIQDELRRLQEDKGKIGLVTENNGEFKEGTAEEDLQELRQHINDLKSGNLESNIDDTGAVIRNIDLQFINFEEKNTELKSLKLHVEMLSQNMIDLDKEYQLYKGFESLEDGTELSLTKLQGEIREIEERLRSVKALKEMKLSDRTLGVKDTNDLKLKILKEKKNNSLFTVLTGILLCLAGGWGILKASFPVVVLGCIGVLLLIYGILQWQKTAHGLQEFNELAADYTENYELGYESEEKGLQEDIDKRKKDLEFLLSRCCCGSTSEFLEKLAGFKALKDKRSLLENQQLLLKNEVEKVSERLTALKAVLERAIFNFEMDNEFAALNSNLLLLEKKKKDIEYSIQLRFNHKRELWMVDSELEECQAERKRLEELYSSALIAEEALREAFEEIQQNFAPRLNEEVGKIIGEITGGRYHEVKVSSDYDISVVKDSRSREIGYLSSGTFDQIYLALRLGLCNIIFENRRVPVILDDAFVQYDEERLTRVMDFLKEYSKERQVLIFTCRKLPGENHISINSRA